MIVFPVNFQSKYSIFNFTIEYRDIYEICQGGPEVGYVYINDVVVNKKLVFGGPPLFQDYKMYLPKYVGANFILSEIDLKTKNIKGFDLKKPLILLKEIAGETISYFSDLDNTKLEFFKIK